MKLVFDTCVLFPTVMREVLLAGANVGGWTPLWSDRILEEWARAARKIGPTGELQARSEIALLKAAWPAQAVGWNASLEKRLWLPDANDIHVLAAAVSSSADLIVTVNVKDFPRATLREEGVDRIDPDALLYDLALRAPEALHDQLSAIRQQASDMAGENLSLKVLLQKARLPRLAKKMAALKFD